MELIKTGTEILSGRDWRCGKRDWCNAKNAGRGIRGEELVNRCHGSSRIGLIWHGSPMIMNRVL